MGGTSISFQHFFLQNFPLLTTHMKQSKKYEKKFVNNKRRTGAVPCAVFNEYDLKYLKILALILRLQADFMKE